MANRTQRDEKRRAARLRNNSTHRREQEELLQKELEEEVIELGDDNDVEEVVEKDYYSEPAMAGATSWDEHEAMKMAREKAQHVREVTYTVQDLVSNILYSSMSPAEKSKAIKAVGDGMGAKLKEAEDHMMKKEFDLDLLEIQAIIAKDARQTGAGERLGDWITKARLTSTAESKLSDEDFALVIEREEGTVRRYPIHDKAHVRNALTQAAQAMEKGGEFAEDAKAALPKLREAAKKMGIGTMEKSNSAVVIEKDKSGNWRAVMWPTNNFIDWDGDILSESAHLEFVEWVNKNMDCSPVFMTWHKPGTMRKNRTDFVGYESGFLIMSAPLEEREAAALLKAQTLTDIGMSHSAFAMERDKNDPRVVTKYRMFEVSDLPLKYAANPFTDFETLLKEADMSAKDLDTQAYLATILGEEEAKKYIAKAGIKQKALQDAGVENKEKKEEPPAPAAVVSTTPDVDAIFEKVLERVSKELDVNGLNEYLTDLQASASKVEVLEELVKNLAKSREDDLVEMIEPPATKTMVWQKARASQRKETVLEDGKEDDETLKKAKPELGWLSEATNTTPVQA